MIRISVRSYMIVIVVLLAGGIALGLGIGHAVWG